MEMKAVWTTAYINDLPDECFLYIEPGGEKDEEGKTVPRSKRHLPYRNRKGKIDLPHLRNAIARLSQPATGTGDDKWLTEELRQRLLRKARRLLAEATGREEEEEEEEKSYVVRAVLEEDDTITLGGWAIIFNTQDLEHETFTPATKFYLEGPVAQRPVFYDHGLDPAIGKQQIGWAELTIDPEGIWALIQLDRHKAYVERIRELARQGVLGLSSGSAGHLREVENGVITSWPIVEVSLTPTPAEPRTLGVKDLSEIMPVAAKFLPAGLAKQLEGGNEMEEKTLEEIRSLLQELVNKPDRAGVALPQEPENTTKSFGDFLRSIALRDEARLSRLYGVKQMATSPGSAGGYLVPSQYAAELFQVAGETSFVLPRARVIRSHGPYFCPTIDLSSGSAGIPAWYGGVRFYWHEEGAALTETDFGLEQIQLQDRGLGAYTLVSNRLLRSSAVDVDAELRRLFGQAMGWYLDYYFLRGDGAGKPLGIMNCDALVSVTRGASNTFTPEDAGNMMARLLPSSHRNAVWLMNPTVLPELVGFSTGYTPVWYPNVQQGVPGTLMGLPIIFTEKLPTLGTAGDVMLVDLAYYAVLMPQEMEVAVSEHYRFINDQTAYRIALWVDGQPLVRSPITLADGNTTVSPFVRLQ